MKPSLTTCSTSRLGRVVAVSVETVRIVKALPVAFAPA